MFKKIVTGMWIVQMCHKRWETYTFEDIVRLATQPKETNLYIDPDHIDFTDLQICRLQLAVILRGDMELK